MTVSVFTTATCGQRIAGAHNLASSINAVMELSSTGVVKATAILSGLTAVGIRVGDVATSALVNGWEVELLSWSNLTFTNSNHTLVGAVGAISITLTAGIVLALVHNASAVTRIAGHASTSVKAELITAISIAVTAISTSRGNALTLSVASHINTIVWVVITVLVNDTASISTAADEWQLLTKTFIIAMNIEASCVNTRLTISIGETCARSGTVHTRVVNALVNSGNHTIVTVAVIQTASSAVHRNASLKAGAVGTQIALKALAWMAGLRTLAVSSALGARHTLTGSRAAVLTHVVVGTITVGHTTSRDATLTATLTLTITNSNKAVGKIVIGRAVGMLIVATTLNGHVATLTELQISVSIVNGMTLVNRTAVAIITVLAVKTANKHFLTGLRGRVAHILETRIRMLLAAHSVTKVVLRRSPAAIVHTLATRAHRAVASQRTRGRNNLTSTKLVRVLH